jgi:hypothetical protein
VIRAGDLARLSPEEIQFLDAIVRKLALPAPDAPQNQIESKPAIELDERPSGMQERIPSGEAASGSDGLYEAVIAYHEAGPSSLSGKGNNEKHVIAINERSQVVAQLRSRHLGPYDPF